MGKNLEINEKLEKYIEEYSYSLHPVQKEIISYNETLGDIKRMQISVSQCHFLELLIKTSNTNKILEIGTFTGLSSLSMSLALPNKGQLITLDKNSKTKSCGRKRKIIIGKLNVNITSSFISIKYIRYNKY